MIIKYDIKVVPDSQILWRSYFYSITEDKFYARTEEELINKIFLGQISID